MHTEKKFWKEMSNFTVSKVIITVWNGIAFCYHVWFIGFDLWTSLILQGTAFIMEYLLCEWYEKMLIKSNKKINQQTEFITWPLQILKRGIKKYVTFTGIFILVYVTTYYLRLKFFYLIDFGVNQHKLEQSIINMLYFTPIGAPIMAILVIERKKKKKSIEGRKKWLEKINFGPFT